MAQTVIYPSMRFCVFEGTTPSTATAYRQTVPFISSYTGNCYYLAMSILNKSNNTWYQMTNGQFSSPPFLNGADLRFTLASDQVSNYGGQPLRALIAYCR